MGWFNKEPKNKEGPQLANLPELPKLPDLPRLPDSPNISSASISSSQETVKSPKPKPNILPRFPSSSLGDKFSQNTIKDAVSGEKEEREIADEPEEEIQTMPHLPKGNLTRETFGMERGDALSNREKSAQRKSAPKEYDYNEDDEETPVEPVFVRLDRFEDSKALFRRIKKQVSGVDKLLNDLKDLKEKEEEELGSWQERLEEMKRQIEQIDSDIFSKLK